MNVDFSLDGSNREREVQQKEKVGEEKKRKMAGE